MTELVDAKMVDELSRVLSFPLERIIWGQLTTAKNYWIRYRAATKGVEELPYMSFYRIHRFHEQIKKSSTLEVIDIDNTSKKMKFMPVILSYTVEIMTAKVADQNKMVKRFMLWAGTEAAVNFKDATGVDWAFRIIPEDPEDNSDLEMEDDYGRVIRTTLNFQVESILLERDEVVAAPILEILSNIHLYYNNTDDSIKAVELNVQSGD